MDLATINEDPDLHDTPLGRVMLTQPTPKGVVFAVGTHPNSGEQVILGVVDPPTSRGVQDAFYGKRQWEAQHVWEKAERQRLAKEAADEREHTDRRRDFVRALDKRIAGSADGREDFIRALMSYGGGRR